MKNVKLGAVALLCVFCTLGIIKAAAIKVHTIGDSTMANYDESATVTRGWGMYLQQFLTGVTVNNRGKSGSSSKSFYQEAAYWTTVKQQMQNGDYVFIQFSHNDEKTQGMDGDSLIAYYKSIGDTESATATDYRGTTPSGTYKDYLRKYVNETRAAGCIPVLVAPICRMYFSGSTINRAGRHDLGDSFSKLTSSGVTTSNSVGQDDHSMDYVYQMKSVADEMNVPFIDLTTATAELYISYGDTKCHELLSDGNGSTHLNTTGATLVARLCAKKMKEQGILADNVSLTSDLSVTPSDADLGESYKGQTITKEFSLSGFDLTPTEGTINISCSSGLKLSTDKTSWSNAISMSYTSGTLIKTFYAQCELINAGNISETITITQGDKTITVPVKAKAIALEGGQAVTAYWRLESDASCTLTGPAVPIEETFSNMYVQRYSNPNANTTWPDGTGFTATRKTQRDLIVGDTWPAGEIDEVSNRYIQFAITASKGTTLKIDSIGLYVCGCGGNGMMCHINYSTEPNFANQHTIFAPTKMVANNMMSVTAMPVISLNEGDTLRLRIYPWYNSTSTASGKTICISDVTIKGMAMDNTANGIQYNVSDEKPIKTSLYDICGRETTQTRPRGIYIARKEYANGKIESYKFVSK
jgi:lysophospholipase L1-like esterase